MAVGGRRGRCALPYPGDPPKDPGLAGWPAVGLRGVSVPLPLLPAHRAPHGDEVRLRRRAGQRGGGKARKGSHLYALGVLSPHPGMVEQKLRHRISISRCGAVQPDGLGLYGAPDLPDRPAHLEAPAGSHAGGGHRVLLAVVLLLRLRDQQRTPGDVLYAAGELFRDAGVGDGHGGKCPFDKLRDR